jgi:hypothetical protein
MTIFESKQDLLATVKDDIAKAIARGISKDVILQRLTSRGLERDKAVLLIDQVDREIGADLNDRERRRKIDRKEAYAQIAQGGGSFLLGTTLTVAGLIFAHFFGGFYLVFFGMILFGGFRLVMGIISLMQVGVQ